MVNYTYENLFRQDSIDKQIKIDILGENLFKLPLFYKNTHTDTAGYIFTNNKDGSINLNGTNNYNFNASTALYFNDTVGHEHDFDDLVGKTIVLDKPMDGVSYYFMCHSIAYRNKFVVTQDFVDYYWSLYVEIEPHVVLDDVTLCPSFRVLEDTLTNADIYQGTFELEEILCDDRDLTYGSVNSAKVKFTTSYLGELKGKTLRITEVLDGHTDEPFRFGTYKVYEDKFTAGRTLKEIVAYDANYDMLNANVIDWYNTILPDLEASVTLKQFRDSFLSQFGITQKQIALDNDSMLVKKTIGSETLSGATVIKSICATNGCFGRINRDSLFEYFYVHTTSNPLYPALNLYPSEDLFPRYDGDYDATEVGENGTFISAKYEDYDVMPIDKLIIRDSDNEEIISYGSGTNAYIMNSNILLYDKTAIELSNIAESIYNRIEGAYYKPCQIELKGNPCMEIGDGISITPRNYKQFVTFICHRVYTGIQAQRDTYYSEGTQYRTEEVNTFDSQLIQLRGKSNKIERNLEHTISELEDFEEGVASQFEQTASDISAKVSKTDHNEENTFGWVLDTTGFDVQSNGDSVFKVNTSGAEINGKVTATSGYIGNGSEGFTIDSTDIRNGMTSLSDTTNNGVFIGTNGIALGKGKFKVENTGSGKIGAWSFNDNGLTYSNSQGATCAITPSASGGLGGIDIGSQSVTVYGTRESALGKLDNTSNTTVYGNNVSIRANNNPVEIRGGSTGLRVLGDLVVKDFTGSTDYFQAIKQVSGNWYVWGKYPYYNGSDRRLKEEIEELNEESSKEFILNLKPCEYKMKGEKRKHHGFIAQDVKEVMKEDWAVYFENDDEEKTLSLCYTELIADLVATVQNQQKQIDELRREINKLTEGDLK